MTPHVDLVTDLGPDGVSTSTARQHLKSCGVCRRRVEAVLALAQIVREGIASDADSPVGCLSEEEIIAAARTDRAAPSRDASVHLTECERCSAALSEARLVLSASATVRALPAPAVSLPPALKARIRELQPAMPLAAIPRDITRPSGRRQPVRRRKPKPKPRRSK